MVVGVLLVAGLFGCCCVYEDVGVLVFVEKLDSNGVDCELNASSGDVNSYAAAVVVGVVVAAVAAVEVCCEDNTMKKQTEDYLKN